MVSPCTSPALPLHPLLDPLQIFEQPLVPDFLHLCQQLIESLPDRLVPSPLGPQPLKGMSDPPPFATVLLYQLFQIEAYSPQQNKVTTDRLLVHSRGFGGEPLQQLPLTDQRSIVAGHTATADTGWEVGGGHGD